MKQSRFSLDKVQLITAMLIFGTIGLFRRYVPLPSAIIALGRGVIGSVILLLAAVVTKKKMPSEIIRRNLPLLALSGAAIGFNWIFLFEAYCYTSVATATLCYYLAPVLVILLAPLTIRESITRRQLFWVCMAVLGMAMVAGVFGGGQQVQIKGIAFGLASAILYASVILMNKGIHGIQPLIKTLIQLSVASIAMVPYVLIKEDFSALSLSSGSVLSLLVMGVVHTGIAYVLYFSSVERLQTHTVALFSYIDPVAAIILSALFLNEPMTLIGAIGACIILISAYSCEKS